MKIPQRKRINKIGVFLFLSASFFCYHSYVFAQDWKCIIYGDTRNNKPEHKQVLESMKTNTPDFKFIINVGDVVDYGEVKPEWDAWFNTVTSVFGTTGQDKVPPMYMAVPGNHDNTELPVGLENWNYFLSGQNKLYCSDNINGHGGKYFTFDYENVRFIILDSDQSPKNGEQYSLFLKAIENNPRQWLIAVWHDPIFDFGEKKYEDYIHTQWGIPLYNNGADILFMGDAHYYVRSKKLKLNGDKNPPIDLVKGTVQLVTGNGGATMDIPNPNFDNNSYMVENYSKDNTQFGYTELHFKNNNLYLRHILRYGFVLDSAVYTPNPKPTNIDTINKIPTEFKLIQNYPNPFNPTTKISITFQKDLKLNSKYFISSEER